MNSTVFIILLAIFCFFEQDYFSKFLSNYKEFSPYLVIEKGEVIRLISSNLFHINLLHLLINLYTFWNVSTRIEKMYRETYMLLLLNTAILTNIINILISLIWFYFYNDFSNYYLHSLGLNNTIFAFRALYYEKLDRNLSLFGIIIHSSYIIWFDLFLVYLFTPNSNFIGHISGITAGRLINNIF